MDFAYLAQHYFAHPSYLRYDGHPVVIVNNLPTYWNEFGVAGTDSLFRELVDDISHNYGEQLYLIGGVFHNSDPQFLPKSPFQAITVWGNLWSRLGHDPDRTYSYSEYSTSTQRAWEAWHGVAESNGVEFVPLIKPGFDNSAYSATQDHFVIERDIDEFRSLLGRANTLATPGLNTILLFTWNDFNEGTAIEPSNEYGASYLEAIRDAIALDQPGGEQPLSP